MQSSVIRHIMQSSVIRYIMQSSVIRYIMQSGVIRYIMQSGVIRYIMQRGVIRCMVLLAAVLLTCTAWGQGQDSVRRRTLEDVQIEQRRVDGMSRLGGAENGQRIGQDELFRAACCNLGESFVANPSVDVNYNDAAVGARQIKLLGLSGSYVQMLCEGLAMRGGAALPYLLGQVPGSWMRSISVSKGTSSVKHGYRSLTGQIDVEYLKPDEEQGLILNLYGDSRLKGEGNAVGNIHLNEHLSTEVLAHYEHDFMHHDENEDGWVDMPSVEQVNVSNRWKYRRGRYLMHAGIGVLDEHRRGGPTEAFHTSPWIDMRSRGAEAYMKHAYLLDREHNTNLALTATASLYGMDAALGRSATLQKRYEERQGEVNAQLMLEHDFSEEHNLSTGLSLTAGRLEESYNMVAGETGGTTMETVPGVYAQYTYKPDYRLTAMGGLRADYNSLYGRTLVTPRVHLKWVATDWLTLRASSGKGYRTVHPMAEYHYLATSGRTLKIDDEMPMEEAWNSGVSTAFYIPVGERTLTIGAEYYYTNFEEQAVVDYDSDPTAIRIGRLEGRSFSHTAQVDASCDVSDELNIMAAFRLNHVMCSYGGTLREKPLQSRYKGLVTIGWKPMMALWQVDVTLQLNGGGRMPEPYTKADGSLSWEREFPAYPQLNIQVTREFRHMSVYVGAENLTGYRQAVPVIEAGAPTSALFEPTMVWGPVHGTMVYAGLRMHLWRN